LPKAGTHDGYMSEETETVSGLYQQAQKTQLEGDFESAKSLYLEVLKREPEHADALHCLGNIDGVQGRFEDAERLIKKAIALEPLKANFINSLGNLLKVNGRPEEAAAMYDQAVQLRPDFVIAQNNLGELLLGEGQMEAAAQTFLDVLAKDPEFAGAYVNLGRAFNNMGKLDDAAGAFRRAVLIRDDYAVAYDYLGHVLRAQGEMDEARDVLEHALIIDPHLASAHHNLATVLLAQGDVEGGIAAFKKSLGIRPDHVQTLLNLGIAYHTKAAFEEAAATYRRALEIEPENPDLYLNLGLVVNEQLRGEEAEQYFLKALTLRPGWADACAELAAFYEETSRLDELESILTRGLKANPDHERLNLEAAKADRRAGRFDEGISRLEKLDTDRMTPRLAEQVHYQLGYLYDRSGKADSAYTHLQVANKIASETPRARRVRPERFLALIDVLESYFSDFDPEGVTLADKPDREPPVFMLGFPRSGTTLADVVIDSHPDITTVEERVTISPIRERLQAMPGGFPDSISRLSGDEVAMLRKLYFDAMDDAAGEERSRILVDKTPIRTIHVGMLWRLFPDARFIFCLRHPCDVVLSNFMQHYRASDAFTNFYKLADSARAYSRVMDLWRLYAEKLPLRYHTLRYENLVEDLENEGRQLLDFLDVKWDPNVLGYRDSLESRGRINTNSYHQVTEPLYTRSRDRWRAYKKYFEPLMDQLGPHLEYFGYDD
jgi:tetratricopeptide (TPR) repeat protein